MTWKPAKKGRCFRSRRCTFLMVLLLWFPFAGCQNMQAVHVERVLVPGSTKLKRESRYGMAAARMISQLREAQRIGQDFDNELAQWDDKATKEAIDKFRDKELAPRLEGIQSKIKLLQWFFSEDDITRCSPEIPLEIIQAGHWLERNTSDVIERFREIEQGPIKDLVEATVDKDKKKKLEELKERCIKTVKRAVNAGVAAAEDSGQLTFGGFQSSAVYIINPADRKYMEILNCPAAKISCEPLTKVEVGVSGDSSVMIVMESPGQVRVYQVSNDPTQLIRNIAMIVQKATGAAAKYMSGI